MQFPVPPLQQWTPLPALPQVLPHVKVVLSRAESPRKIQHLLQGAAITGAAMVLVIAVLLAPVVGIMW